MRPLEARYAQALFSLFPDEKAFFAAAEQLQQSPELWTVLTHPGIPAGEKRGLLGRVLEDAPALLTDFFSLLCDHKRMELLPEIARAYRALLLQRENALDAVMRCAFAPDDGVLERIKKSLCTLQDKSRVELTVRLEPELIGGFVLEAGGTTYDRSIKGALHSLQNTLKAR